MELGRSYTGAMDSNGCYHTQPQKHGYGLLPPTPEHKPAVVSDSGVVSPAHWSSEELVGRMRRELFETAERQGMKMFCKTLELSTT